MGKQKKKKPLKSFSLIIELKLFPEVLIHLGFNFKRENLGIKEERFLLLWCTVYHNLTIKMNLKKKLFGSVSVQRNITNNISDISITIHLGVLSLLLIISIIVFCFI